MNAEIAKINSTRKFVGLQYWQLYMVLYVQNVQNIMRKCLLYTEVTDRLPWRSTCLRECTFTAM